MHSPSLCREGAPSTPHVHGTAGAEGTLHCSSSLQPPNTSQPGREVLLERRTSFPPGSPTRLSTFRSAPSTALIPYGVFSLTHSSLFGNRAAPLCTEEYTQQRLFQSGEMCTLQSHNWLKNMLMAAGWPRAPGW